MIFNVEEQRIINNSDDYIEGDNIVIDNILRYHLEALLDRGFWILDFGIGTGGKSDMIYLSVDNDLPLDDVPEQFSRIDEYIGCSIVEDDVEDTLVLINTALLVLYDWILEHDLKANRT